MFRRFFVFMLLLVLGAFSAAVSAQPAAVTTALADLNSRTGQNYTLGVDIAYTFTEEFYDGNNLGCPTVENTAPGQIRGYRIEFDTNLDEIYEWDYRVSLDGTIFILCSQPVVATTPQPGTPAPTVAGPTPSQCSSLLPRLTIGAQGRVTPGEPNIVRALPGTSAQFISEIPAGGVFTILDGPRCSGQYTWFQVAYNDVVGWTVENDSTIYWVEPFDPNAPDAQPTPDGAVATIDPLATVEVCDPALPPRLRAGSIGRVTPGYPNNLRADANRNAQKVGEIPGGAVFNVLEGTRCADGLTWWRVEYSGTTGWTVESQDGEYFLNPPSLSNPITVDNADDLVLYSAFDTTDAAAQVQLTAGTTITALASGTLVIWNLRDLFAPVDEVEYIDFREVDSARGDYDSYFNLSAQLPYAVDIQPEQVNVNLLPNGEEAATLLVSDVRRVEFNGSATRLATLDAEGAIQVWDLESGSETFGTALPIQTALYTNVSDLTFAPDGNYLYVASQGQIEGIALMDDLTPVVIQTGELENVKLSFTSDGTTIAVVADYLADPEQDERLSSSLYLVDMANPVLDEPIATTEYVYSAPALTPNGTILAVVDSWAGSSVYMLRLFDMTTGEEVALYELESGNTVRFSDDGGAIIISTEFPPNTFSNVAQQIQLWGVALDQ